VKSSHRVAKTVDEPFFAREFPSTLDAMRETIASALDALEEGNWIEPDQHNYARLCLEEALVNAIIHGNKADRKRKVCVEMVDEGESCPVQPSTPRAVRTVSIRSFRPAFQLKTRHQKIEVS